MIQIKQISATLSLGLLDLKAFSEQHQLSAKREQEKAGTQFVLTQLIGPGYKGLDYTEHNKPYLVGDNRHISISHSHDKLAVLLNAERSTGVDIELVRDKVLRIKDKFLNAQEAVFAGKDLHRLIAIWAAKEAMYKWYGLKSLDFRIHLSVEDFEEMDIIGKIETGALSQRFHLRKEQIGAYILVYIVDEI